LVEEAFAQNTLAVHENGVPASYLRYEAGEYQTLGKKDRNGWTPVKVQRFEPRSVAMFLEGAVHYMRTFPEQAEQVYKSVRASELYDQELLMFRVCEPLEGEPPELGRITAYPTGWLEHASIYTHMSFKWLLELLRAGLYDAFFDTLKTCLPPYMEPEVYGRSLLENSSFIVSSLYQDQSKHGQAFQPRLSGVTAEWLQIWTMMVAGQQPFKLSDSNELILSLEPVLPDWIFTKKTTIQRFGDDEQFELPENCFACLLFGSTKLIYQNPSRRSTYGADNVKVTSAIVHYKDGREVHVDAGFFEGDLARDVREGLIESIHATLG
jgi:hypothetical protein